MPPNASYFRFSLASLGTIAVGYLVASVFRLPLGSVAVAGGGLLLVGAAGYRELAWAQLHREISWSLFAFISGMFVVVRGVEDIGLTGAFGAALLELSGGDSLRAVLLVAAGTALGANVINNVPMALVMRSALAMTPPGPGQEVLGYAAVLGASQGSARWRRCSGYWSCAGEA